MKTLKCLLVAVSLLGVGISPALANEPGTWTIYMGAASVQPDSKGLSFIDPIDDVTLNIDVKSASSMTLGATYFVTENWAVDLLAALPFKHDVMATAVIPGEDPVTARVGSVKQIPPTLSAQYHFTTEGGFDPYVGVGVNFTLFSDETFIQEMIDEGLGFELDDSTGVAGQIGGNWAFAENWLFNFDVRYVDIGADARLVGPALADFDGEFSIGTINIDPWVYAVNLGYQFE